MHFGDWNDFASVVFFFFFFDFMKSRLSLRSNQSKYNLNFHWRCCGSGQLSQLVPKGPTIMQLVIEGVVMYCQKGGGGGEEAPSLSTARGAPQNGDGPDQADVVLMPLMALPCHKKKVKQQKVLSRAHLNWWLFTKKICTLSTSAISESTNARGKNRSNHMGDCHRVHGSRSGKEGALHLNTAKFSLFRLSANLCCNWCWSLRSRSYQDPLIKTERATPSRSPAEHSVGFPLVRLASCRFGRHHFEAHLAPCWNRALPCPFFFFFGDTQHTLVIATEWMLFS